MGCWADTIDDLKTAIAGTSAFQTFIAEWGGTAGDAADRVFLHDWPDSVIESDHYEVEELEEKYRAYAMLLIPDEGGFAIRKALATRTAFIHGQIEIEIARLVPHDIRSDMSAVLQQAICKTEPIITEVMEATDGLWQSSGNEGRPWRYSKEVRGTMGDYHGVNYFLEWGHPQGSN